MPVKRSDGNLTAEELRIALPPKRQAFVEYLLANPGATATSAALAAGYSRHSARKTSHIIKLDPRVAAAIAAGRTEMAVRNNYSQDSCMAELGKAMEVALSTENASAYVRAIELRGKLNGLIVDKLDARVLVGTFQLTVSGFDPGGGGK